MNDLPQRPRADRLSTVNQERTAVLREGLSRAFPVERDCPFAGLIAAIDAADRHNKG